METALHEAQKNGAPLEQQTAFLERIIGLQRYLVVDKKKTDDQALHLQRLEQELDTVRARLEAPRIAELRAAAEKAVAAGQFESAADSARTARNLQRAINHSRATADIKDVALERSLDMLLTSTQAVPAANEVARELKDARQAVKESLIDDARAAYARARQTQTEINQRFPGTAYNNQSLLTQIDSELASAESAILTRQIQDLVARSDLAAAANQPDKAAELLGTALTKQRECAARYPDIASSADLDALDRKLQTLQSLKLADAALDLDRQAAGLLRTRSIQPAMTIVGRALETLETAARQFPKSDRLDRGLMRKLIFIRLYEADLADLQKQIANQLAPVPGHPGLLMQKTEMPQDLYTRIMNTNPSRNIGVHLPADSVTWREASVCCERLSWLMGATVRLPTPEEWRAAAGADTVAAWTAQTSNAHTQETGKSPVNTAGFGDLEGNVAEWLQPATPASNEAPVAGGTFLDTTDLIRQTPVRPLNRSARDRATGFRIVMQTP